MDLNNNITDIIFLLILIVSFFIGYSRGFIKESLALLGWILSGWIAINYHSLLTIHIRQLINPQIIADAISFGVIFLSVVILTTLITHILSNNIKNSLLGPLDKLLGIIFSIIRSILIISIISIGLQQTIWKDKSIPEWIKNTYSYSIIDPINKLIIKFIPNQTLTFNSNSLNIKNIIDNKDLISNEIINNVDSSDGSYTPSDVNQMNELNNTETMEINENN
tara:strand:+ start:448 stop:1113 length:666 start_codon:yes stop_codon:yes gene_type:complete